MNKAVLDDVLARHRMWLIDNQFGSRADLSGADIQGATLLGADLRRADLRVANLKGANLKGANLKWASLVGAKLEGAKLTGADLEGATLRGANLTGADLEGATLRGANLTDADLLGADLRRADLRGAGIQVASIGWVALAEWIATGPYEVMQPICADPSCVQHAMLAHELCADCRTILLSSADDSNKVTIAKTVPNRPIPTLQEWVQKPLGTVGEKHDG